MTDIKEFFKLYFPASKFKRAWQNAIAFFAPDDDQAELDALQATIDDLGRQRRIISQQEPQPEPGSSMCTACIAPSC